MKQLPKFRLPPTLWLPNAFRFWALPSLIGSFVAFILIMVTIFAGSSIGALQDAEVMTLNTTMLGQTIFPTSTPAMTNDAVVSSADMNKNSSMAMCEGMGFIAKLGCVATNTPAQPAMKAAAGDPKPKDCEDMGIIGKLGCFANNAVQPMVRAAVQNDDQEPDDCSGIDLMERLGCFANNAIAPISRAAISANGTAADCDNESIFQKLGCSLKGAAQNVFQTAIAGIKNEIGMELNQALGNVVRSLGVQDFYSVHLMTICQGTYANGTAGDNSGRNVTFCSARTANFDFNTTQSLDKSLPLGLNLKDVQPLSDGVDLLKTVFLALFVLYVLAASFTGLSILSGLAAFVTGGQKIAAVNLILNALGLSALLIASILGTALGAIASGVMNEFGVGVMVFKGGKYLALTWVATVAMIVATVAEGVAGVCLHPKRKARKAKEALM